MEKTKEREDRLWHIRANAAFKSHLILYLFANAGLWGLWFITDNELFQGVPWPVWPVTTWGLFLAFQYYNEKRQQTRY
ncbi:2TM domain-containing protein [Chitinophaga sp. sic0106]|uniref:2TM domain-containing protein n=1 Tax=Chitinophaga sp. sic0106 TaxID=2854785 RepID=UPI001C488F30|nr:2TM domain-containing protein [Chitinophaga sp. sic0106]MBV7533482.1 2TM domain-containing protein [Chitinophaga sp. sic0106]